MTYHHYATVDLDLFIAASRVPMPPDSYLAKNEQTTALRELLGNGYELAFIEPSLNIAIFHRGKPDFAPNVRAALANPQPHAPQ